MTTVTIITPTTGRQSLGRLIESIDNQLGAAHIKHLLLWDDARDAQDIDPIRYNSSNRFSIIAPAKTGKIGNAPGSLLRALGLMCATSDYVTFADDDVWWENNHIATMLSCLSGGLKWASCLRRVWSPEGVCLGVDRFESVGDSLPRRTPYEMCDNNTMLFERRLGSAGAAIYRETTEYNDDRLFYAFLKSQAGPRGFTNLVTVNHICPPNLTDFFSKNCT